MPKEAREMPPPSPRARANLLSFFTNALATFSARASPFSVICTIPGTSSPPAPAPVAKPPARLVILDSSFNPPTIAHARMVLSAVSHYHSATTPSSTGEDEGHGVSGLRVLLLLSVTNADKAPQPASFPHRLSMMHLFAQDLHTNLPPGLEIDIALSSQPFFHTKSSLIAQEARYTRTEQIFLLGYDTLVRVFDPRYYAAGGTMEGSLGPLFGRARLRVAMRVGDRWGEEGEQRAYLEGLRDGGLEGVGGRGEWASRVELVPGEAEGEVVSSSAVRAAVVEGDEGALGRLLGEGVRGWVVGEGLYKT